MAAKTDKRISIALLINKTSGNYQVHVWTTVAEMAKKLDINLFIFDGKYPESPYGFEYQTHLLVDLIDRNIIDGVVLVTGTLWDYFPTAHEIETFNKSVGKIPIVSIAQKIDGINSVQVENKSGMKEAVRHLIEKHGYRKIAFIKGPENNQEAILRYEAYLEVLAEFQIPNNPDLILPGTFLPASGEAAARILVEDRKEEFDAIVAANDDMAIAAMKYLKTKGYEIPRDFAVIGFDDVDEASSSIPPLTTIRQPLYKQAEKAVELILKVIKKGVDTGISDIILPTELVIRQSCGCFSEQIMAIDEHFNLDHFIGHKKDSEKALNNEIQDIFNLDVENKIKNLNTPLPIIQALNNYNNNQADAAVFLKTIYEGAIRDVENDRDANLWNNIITSCRDYTFQQQQDINFIIHAENLFHKSRSLIGEIMQLDQAVDRINYERSIWTLFDIIQKLITTFDIEKLMDLLTVELPRLSINKIFITLYTEEVKFNKTDLWKYPNLTKIALAYHSGERFDYHKTITFSSSQLLPAEFWQTDNRCSYMIQPLSFRDDQLGFIIMEVGDFVGIVYEMLRVQIGTAVKGGLLLTERKKVETHLIEALDELEKSNNKLQDLSLRDSLTGLYNRRGFMTLGEQHVKLAQTSDEDFLVAYADLDGLKHINDSFGHKEGDNAIIQLADTLKSTFRGADIIARLGGDEFTVLAIDSSVKNIDAITTRLEDHISQYNLRSNKPYRLSVSLGIVSFHANRNCSFEELLKLADDILYDMKMEKKRKNRGN